MVGLTRFELVTPRLSSVCSNQLSYRPDFATGSVGASPRAVLRPTRKTIKEPDFVRRRAYGASATPPAPSKLDRTCLHETLSTRSILSGLRLTAHGLRHEPRPSPDSRKEVIQPQVLLQLPCYDFTPITDHTLGACLPCGLVLRLLVQPAFVM